MNAVRQVKYAALEDYVEQFGAHKTQTVLAASECLKICAQIRDAHNTIQSISKG
jgi:hypothetical protein